MKYNLNDKPDFKAMLLYGLQWFIVTFPAIIIIGGVVSKLHDNNTAFQIAYMQKMFAVAGIFTVVQVLSGHKLPLVIGPATVILISIIATASAGMAAVYTAICLGGVFVAILAFSGILSKLQVLFTPRIIAVILMLIAITLLPTILKLINGDGTRSGFNFLFAIILLLVIVTTNTLLKGVWKSTTVVWGIGFGSLIYLFFTGFPSSIPNESTLSLNNLLLPSFDFNIGVLLSFLISYIAIIINELGSIESVGHLLKAGNMNQRIRKGTGILGISNIVSGGLGIIGSVDFSLSAGVISATGCASRYTLVPAGIALILCAFFPTVIGVFLSIPSVVMGVLLFYLMSTQLSTGFQMLSNGNSIKNITQGMTVAVPVMMAIGVAFAPISLKESIPDMLRPIVDNGFVMGTITVVLLEHLIFRRENR